MNELRGALLNKKFLEVVQTAVPAGVQLDAVRLAWVIINYAETPNDKGQTPLLSAPVDSMRLAMLKCAEVGLEPGFGGACWIVPRGGKATFQMGALGHIELALRSGGKRCWAEVVYEADAFEAKRGGEPVLKHDISKSWSLPGRNCDYDHRQMISVEEGGCGKPLGAYACLELEDGTVDWTLMPEVELQQARAASKMKDGATYKQWPDQMRLRSVIARASKRWPRKMRLQSSEDATHPELLDRLVAIEAASAPKALAAPQAALDRILSEAKGATPELAQPEAAVEREELERDAEEEPPFSTSRADDDFYKDEKE